MLRCDLWTGGTVAARVPRSRGRGSSRSRNLPGPCEPRLLQGEVEKAACPALGRGLRGARGAEGLSGGGTVEA